MAVILSTKETEELNNLLASKSIPYAVSLTDGCGWQTFRLKPRGESKQDEAPSSQELNRLRAIVYNYVSSKYPKDPFDVHFHEGRREFYIR